MILVSELAHRVCNSPSEISDNALKVQVIGVLNVRIAVLGLSGLRENPSTSCSISRCDIVGDPDRPDLGQFEGQT